MMKVLLKYASNVKVTPDTLSTAAGIGTDNRSGFMERDFVLLLLAHDEPATVPQYLSRTILTSYWDTETLNYLTILLDRATGSSDTVRILGKHFTALDQEEPI